MNGYMEQILNKIRKLKKKHIIMAVAVFILLIILIVFIGHIQEKVYKEKVKNNEYESANDFKTAKEYIIYSGNEYIREEKSKEENIEIDIYVKFTVNLYEEEKSNEEFFTDLVNIVANTSFEILHVILSSGNNSFSFCPNNFKILLQNLYPYILFKALNLFISAVIIYLFFSVCSNKYLVPFSLK